MKRICIFLSALIVVMGLSVSAHGALVNNGGGLIYHTDGNATWLQNADLAATKTFGVLGIAADGSMQWSTALAWIAAMNLADYLGHNDWRLPVSDTCIGAGCIGSEMGHMNLDEGITSGTPFPFTHVKPNYYWYSTVYIPAPTNSYAFNFGNSSQDISTQGNYFFAWAIRDGNTAPVPEPGTLLLLGTGGVAGLIALRRKLVQKVN